MRKEAIILLVGLLPVAVLACICGGLSQQHRVETAVAQTVTAIVARTASPTATRTPTCTRTPTITLTSTDTMTPTITLTATTTLTPTKTRTATVTFTPTVTLPAVSSAACVPKTTERQIGRVTYVHDGDTINVLIGGEVFTVRYIGIDTPERGQRYTYQATTANLDLVGGQWVTLVRDVSETDRYGRLLRYVFVGDVFVNYQLVSRGFAVASTYPPDVACADTFVDAQRTARERRIGMWAPTATPPPYVPPAPERENCDPSYPHPVCIRPPPPDLDCKDIPHRRFRVLPPDPHNFDGDHDGIGCESG